MRDRNFDDIAEKFSRNIYGTTKGQLRQTILWQDLDTILATFGGQTLRVLDAGADFQRYPTADLALLEANYVLELEDGHRILVENRAVRVADSDDLAKMMAGQQVNPSRVYFRCVPALSADDSGPYAWMNRTLFVGTGERRPEGVRIDVFRVE